MLVADRRSTEPSPENYELAGDRRVDQRPPRQTGSSSTRESATDQSSSRPWRKASVSSASLQLDRLPDSYGTVLGGIGGSTEAAEIGELIASWGRGGAPTVKNVKIVHLGPTQFHPRWTAFSGEDFLSHFDMELDLGDHIRCGLFKTEGCSPAAVGDRVVYWNKAPIPWSPIVSLERRRRAVARSTSMLNGREVLTRFSIPARLRFGRRFPPAAAREAGVTPSATSPVKAGSIVRIWSATTVSASTDHRSRHISDRR